MKFRVLVTIAGILLASGAWAQEPPSWINLGGPGGTSVRDLLELPAYNTILACGFYYFEPYGWYYDRIWKTIDGGASWSEKLNLNAESNASCFKTLLSDASTGKIWCLRTGGDPVLCYSADVGESWTSLNGPNTNPKIAGEAIELLSGYLYFGGSVNNPYSISLWRLRTDSLTWEMVTQYPECNSITKLKVHNGNLLVFAKDKDENVMRVFSYTPTSLDAKATPVGKVEVTTPEPGR